MAYFQTLKPSSRSKSPGPDSSLGLKRRAGTGAGASEQTTPTSAGRVNIHPPDTDRTPTQSAQHIQQPARHRPDTPLDFLQTMHRRVRSSMESERPFRLDHPKGVPYGFPDDSTTSTPLAVGQGESASSSLIAPPTSASTSGGQAVQPGVGAVRRLGTFRESTRSKLASFSGFSRESKPTSAPSSGLGSPVKVSRPGMAARSSSLAVDAGHGQSHHSELRAVSGSTSRKPSMYVPTTPGLTDDKSVTTIESTSSAPLSTASHEHTEDLMTPSSAQHYPPSVTSTQSSGSRRDRVMGRKVDDGAAPGARAFVPQKMSDVVPFADGNPFAAWDTGDSAHSHGSSHGHGHAGRTKRRPSVTAGAGKMMRVGEDPMTGAAGVAEGSGFEHEERWEVDVRGKKTWKGDVGVYRVGWERAVPDLEGRLHEAMWEIKESHTFAEFAQGQEPKTVLDIGTGTGLWPISQALVWPNATFIGLDIVPCQTDLYPLVESEKRARTTSEGVAVGEGMWEGVAKRITWDRGNFLDGLPYDDAVFELVHLRFLGLGIPEPKWYDLLESCTRVLKSNGTLEIVEMAYTPGPSAGLAVRNSFASLLLADMVQPNTLLPLRFNLPSCEGLKAGARPTFERTWSRGEGGVGAVIGEAAGVWVKSALGYKGTGLKKGGEGVGVLRELRGVDAVWGEGERAGRLEPGGIGADKKKATAEEIKAEEVNEVSVWVWVVKRR